MIAIYYCLSIIVISIVLGEIRYRYLLKSQKDNGVIIEKDWRKSIDKDFVDFDINDISIKEAMTCEFAQML